MRRPCLMLFCQRQLEVGAIGVMNWKGGRVVQDGVLTYAAVNGICGVITLTILVVYVVNYLLAKREAGE